jgi:hypothetical protein
MFWMLIRPSSVARDLFVDLFHGLYCSGSMCVGVIGVVWLGWCGILIQAETLVLICWVISWVVLLWFDVCWCYVVVLLGGFGILMQAETLLPASGYHTTPAKPQRNTNTSYQSNTTHEITQQISRKLLRMDVLTFETCWALNKEINKQVTSSWSLFIQLSVCQYYEYISCNDIDKIFSVKCCRIYI